MKYLHNPRCSKSRQGLKILEEAGKSPEIVEYLKDVPSAKEIAAILKKTGLKAEELLRKNESIFKENFLGKSYTEGEWIDIMAANPKLIERPIFINGNKAVLGRPPEKVLTIL